MPKLLIFTGAGISAESGLSTFRGDDGLWEGHEIDRVCNYRTWKQNFDEVHGFYNMLRGKLEHAQPNSAHFKVAEWQRHYETILLTQNCDDLLERAGCTNVVHLHGDLCSVRCEACGAVSQIGYREWSPEDRCPCCNSLKGVKPNVVFFNEQAPLYADLHKHLRNLEEHDLVVVIGTSSQVVPIGLYLERRPGFKILNNLEPSSDPEIQQIDEIAYNVRYYKPATQAVDEIDELLRG